MIPAAERRRRECRRRLLEAAMDVTGAGDDEDVRASLRVEIEALRYTEASLEAVADEHRRKEGK